MQFELWGVSEALGIQLPDRPLGYLLLVLYILLGLYAIYSHRNHFAQLTTKKWAITALLAVGSLLFSQLFLIIIFFNDQLAPPGTVQNPAATLALFGSVPFLLAAAVLNPAAALIVGFCSGLGRALAQTHQIFDPFHFALAAVLAAHWLQQNYADRLYRLLRQPVVAGLLANFVIIPLVALGVFASTPADSSNLIALDLALSTAKAHLLPLLMEGIIAGAVIAVVLMGVPDLKPQQLPLIPSPQSRRLSQHLLRDFALFAIPLLLVLAIMVFNLAVNISTRLVLSQIAHDANTVAAQIPSYRSYRQNLLNQYSEEAAFLSDDPAAYERTLSQLFRTGDLFRHVILVDDGGEVRAFYPADTSDLQLSDLERTAVNRTLNSGAPTVSPGQPGNQATSIISFISPVFDADGRPVAALIGRVPDISLDILITGLQDHVGTATGFIVDENAVVIAHPDKSNLGKPWPISAVSRRLLGTEATAAGVAYEGRSPQTNARQLVYLRPGSADHPWTVVMTAPYEAVLALALQIGLPLTGVFIGAVALTAGGITLLGRNISSPIQHLVQASQSIAGGSLDTPIHTEGADEIGQLSQAFVKMQRSLKRRLDELQLLVDVSQEVSATLNIDDGMPAILQGAIRGTGASGARAVVLNPHDHHPLTFSEGPAGNDMSQFDRRIMSQLHHQRELILTAPAAVQASLSEGPTTADGRPPFKALLAIGLYNHDRFQGIFWLAYRQPHQFDPIELNLVRTLASQASVLVENARLFASATSGRRRLAAVLASTTDAVIVTDQTERVLLVNPAMERTFNLKANQVIGRAVKDVIKDEKLLEALVTSDKRIRNLEIVTAAGRTLHANAAPISSDGQAMGRVAVLHDITQLKEIDEMKSEFVATVSHDLRGPLSYMNGYIMMLPMVGELNEKQEAYIQKVLSGIDQMSHLIMDLLDLGRIESGVELDLSEVHIGPMLTYIATDHTQPAQNSGIEFVVKAQPDLPAVMGDNNLIRQAITNLVGNAIKYAPGTGEVLLQATMDNGEVVVSVTDHGPGVAEQYQKRIFDQFYRVKQRETVGIKGSGLGLAIVRSIAERHGGRAWCESEPGKGSTFYVAFPLQARNKEN